MKQGKKRKLIDVFCRVLLAAAAAVCAAPVFFLLIGSMMGTTELNTCIFPVLSGGDGFASWRLFPEYPTLRHMVEVLFDSPEFFHMFWNTAKIAVGIFLGQMLFAVPAAWGMAHGTFPGKEIVRRLYLWLLMMPFCVVMLSEYLVLDKLGINDTLWALILPGICGTFPVIWMSRFFEEIPQEVLEAAQMDGAGEWQIFLRIGLPLAKGGIAAVMLMQFLENYGMMEQPAAFLKKKSLFPLSLYLSQMDMAQAGTAVCASFLVLLPALFLFLAGAETLEQGIRASLREE